MTRDDYTREHLSHSIDRVVEELDKRSNLLQEYSDLIRRRSQEIKDGKKTPIGNVSLSDRSRWVMNDIENMIRNLNLSSLTGTICQLSVVESQVEELPK